MQDIHSILKDYWGYNSFRASQEAIIHSVLAKKDTLAILPTGGGKSLCFQVPALAMEGICLVVSPLIALMKDQVDNLKKRDIPALLIHSGMKRADVVQSLKNATHDYFRFLYVSPERLETSLFLEYLPALNVNLIAVDEAHCISQWGYDFRPSYLRIAALRKELPGVPVLALTASATRQVQDDICDKLEFREKTIFRQSFERANLSYSVFKEEAKIPRLVHILSKVPGSAIVYCKSRKRTGEIAQLLSAEGLKAGAYHAGLTSEERNSRQKEWVNNNIRVMVCTNAFGMGIDKPDVRLVVHMDLPDCPENYYQEAGRAGRDGEKAYAVLLCNDEDLKELEEAHLVRYPSLEQIRRVYGALVNFLQIPSYTGEYQGFNFRFDEFVRNFKFSSREALYALKALEQDGWLQFNERSFSPATVCFTTSKEQLYDFYRSHPALEPLLTTLLRNYSGIFDFPSFISELQLAKNLRKEEAEIQKLLKEAASFGIISYAPLNEEPRIVFLKHRVPASELSFNLKAYHRRKEIFMQRCREMIRYTGLDSCRSRFISDYFGDSEAVDCGVCDNCLRRKAGDLTTEEFDRIASQIRDQLTLHPRTARELLEQMGSLKKEKAWRVIEFLQSEKRVEVDGGGVMRWR